MSLSELESFAFSRILNDTPTNLSCASSRSSSSTCAFGLHSLYFIFLFLSIFPRNNGLWWKGCMGASHFLRGTFLTMSPCVPLLRGCGETPPLDNQCPGSASPTLGNTSLCSIERNSICVCFKEKWWSLFAFVSKEWTLLSLPSPAQVTCANSCISKLHCGQLQMSEIWLNGCMNNLIAICIF